MISLVALATSTPGLTQWLPAIAALVPLVLAIGSLKYFRDWVYSEKEIKAKTALARETIAEKLAERHTELLEALIANKPLRGAPPQKTDYVGGYSRSLQKLMSLLFRFEALRVEAEGAYGALLLTLFVGIVVLIAGALIPLAQETWLCGYVIGAAIVLVLMQAAIVFWLRRLSQHLDQIDESL